jgi:putative membrane protein
MIRWILHVAIATAGLLVLPYIFSGVQINHWQSALLAAVLLGLVNTFVKPVVNVLTLPIRVLTLGVVSLLINGAFMLFVTKLVDGFSIDTYWTAILAAIVYSVINWAAGVVVSVGRDD